MKSLKYFILLVAALVSISLVGCDWCMKTYNSKQFYNENDFDFIIVGETTIHDVYKVAQTQVIYPAWYGSYCDYPLDDGSCIRVKFDYKDVVCGVEEVLDKNDFPMQKYKIDEIENLKSAAESGKMTFAEFEKSFLVQCVRKTYQGCYVVLLLEDESNVYAFFNNENILFKVMIAKEFKGKAEFLQHIVEGIPKSSVLDFDSNTIFLSAASGDITAHIVQEGVFIVRYLRFLDGKTVADPIVSSIEFIENEDMSMSEDPFIVNDIPFIFEFDKIDN